MHAQRWARAEGGRQSVLGRSKRREAQGTGQRPVSTLVGAAEQLSDLAGSLSWPQLR